MTAFSALLIGNESLLIQCAERLRERGHQISAVVTHNPDIAAWAMAQDLRTEAPGADLAARLSGSDCDWLLSIANLSVIPEDVLALAAKGAVNFHDGPLPRYAGLNAPVWAVISREPRHGVRWHLIEGGVDEGDILAGRDFDIASEETALTLNTRCYEAAIESFDDLVTELESGTPAGQPQDLSGRSYFGRVDRPTAAARLDFTRPAEELVALVRGLDHGTYWNPLCLPKIAIGDRVLLVRKARIGAEAPGGAVPGMVLDSAESGLVVATGTGALVIEQLSDLSGAEIAPGEAAGAGVILASPADEEAAHLTEAMAAVARHDGYWRRRLVALEPADLPRARPAGEAEPDWQHRDLALPAGQTRDRSRALIAALASLSEGKEEIDIAWRGVWATQGSGYLSDWVPLRFAGGTTRFDDAAAALEAERSEALRRGPFATDLPARDPALAALAVPPVAIAEDETGAPIAGGVVSFHLPSTGSATLVFDAARLPPEEAERLIDRLAVLAAAEAAGGLGSLAVGQLPVMTEAERKQVLQDWNATEMAWPANLCVHQAISAQAARTPHAPALAFEDRVLSYAELDAQANRVAQVLQDKGVGPDTLVGLHVPRGPDLVIGALAIWKAGGAYVPLDPAYPADRIALYIEDSAAPALISHSAVAGDLPAHSAELLVIDTDPRIAEASAEPAESTVAPENLAYVIYTSGSTGRPKGVMVEHRNVMNFFAGMDDRIPHEMPGTWLAVTSLSFDISVLELFWTLARGFELVLSGEEDRAMVSSGTLEVTGRGMDFSLFYWGNDDGVGRAKYRLLLEGAKFADTHGFCAVWTPERHFHAFGGPYPNPSVTGAAVAAVTQNLQIRAGSCVAPLHHPARIAEEWAVIDNLTEGRTGLAIASGWQPDDFVLRPENTPPANKPAMYDSIEILRKLWRGEAVPFPTKSGDPHEVVTQPRPVSKELPIWVTTAGNPATWREAGEIGANVLTHLLGQSIDEVGEKIRIYHDALRAGGRDPADHKVTLMLHTFVGADRETVRETAREPMKDYLRSAAGLIKQYAWAFPAFKKPKGVSNPFELDLGSLEDEEMEGILEFAFQRYFEDSGLFGTVEDCAARIEQVKRIGVDEIACLIDYGIPAAQVLEGLKPLAEVLEHANRPAEIDPGDFSIAAQILRHRVTHLQCTPSMARMLVTNEDSAHALTHVKHLMVGGEALPGSLVRDLRQRTQASIENMYGPTETTIWSSTAQVEPADMDVAAVTVGRPIANTRLYVLDAAMAPVPVGVPGELWIGGAGVTRGYLNRPDLTEERFRPDPFVDGTGWDDRIYRTGDLVAWRPDGQIAFFGRADHQVKIRGYRIELGEIEARLAAMAGVREAVVIAREDTPGDLRLVAYVTGPSASEAALLRDQLAESLPAHMVPAHVVALAAFPLTPNRKVDRKALPAPSVGAAARETASFEKPSNDVEQRLASIWSRILGVPQIGAKDNFFDLGGHSLLAVQAHREIRVELDAPKLSITDIFRYPQLSALAAHIGGGEEDAEAVAEATAAAETARMSAMEKRRAMRASRRVRG